jgi:hypothetical protein
MHDRDTLIEKARVPSKHGLAHIQTRLIEEATILRPKWLCVSLKAVETEVKAWESSPDCSALVHPQATDPLVLLEMFRSRETFPSIVESNGNFTSYHPLSNTIFVDPELNKDANYGFLYSMKLFTFPNQRDSTETAPGVEVATIQQRRRNILFAMYPL